MATLSEFLGYLAQAQGETVEQKMQYLVDRGSINPQDRAIFMRLALRLTDCLEPQYVQDGMARIILME